MSKQDRCYLNFIQSAVFCLSKAKWKNIVIKYYSDQNPSGKLLEQNKVTWNALHASTGSTLSRAYILFYYTSC